MTGRTISLAYFYIVSLGALILLVVGVFSSVNYLVNVTQYDKYPLRYEQPCETMYGPVPEKPYLPDSPNQASPTAQELETQKEECLKTKEQDRKKQQIEDLRTALSFTIVGLILFVIHFPIALKRSNHQ